MKIAAELRELARNLYWTWQPDVIGLFRSINPSLWREVNHNPVEFLSHLSEQELQKTAAEQAIEVRINRAFHHLRGYLGETRTWGALNAGRLNAHPVAYFSAEFGLHESLPLYSGGLGVLSGDHLKAASDLGVPLVGVGLFYAHGYFNQLLDRDGWQREEYFASDVDKLPLERAIGSDGKPLRVTVETSSSVITLGVWTVRVGRNRLILLDSEVDENSREDRTLTHTLYGGDRRTRIRQELIIGVGGVRALTALGIRPGVIHLNEGHSGFAVLERAAKLMARENRPFHEIQEKAASRNVFTTHTPVEAGHDRFAPDLVEETLRPLRESLRLSPKEFLALGRVKDNDDREPFCMTALCLKMSRWVNAVSAIHARVSRTMWRHLWPSLPEHQVPIGHITNGVHVASWLSPDMERLYNSYLKPGWQSRGSFRETWEPVGGIDDIEFWETHEISKVRLVDWVTRSVRRQCARRGETDENCPYVSPRLDPGVLTIGFARRAATYKRACLILRDLDRLDRLVNNPKTPLQIIFSGKAHPADDPGKRLIQEVFRVTRDGRFAGKIIFIEDHSISVGRHLVQGVDLWLNTPRRPMEACGTSGQKVVVNGGLNMSILDGWWAEAYDGTNGFAIGVGYEHSDPEHQDELDTQAVYDLLERTIVPMYYERNGGGIPLRWVAMQKRAIQTLAWRFSADRMVRDYTLACYLPAAGGLTCHMPDFKGGIGG
ncbi:MAG: alpha-glucan family phosphorylase [Planctomycetota bacterium]